MKGSGENWTASVQSYWSAGGPEVVVRSLGDSVWGLKDTAVLLPPLPHRAPKEVGDVIALSDITSSGAADRSQEPSPVGSRRGRVTPNLSRASSDADHGVSGGVEAGWDTDRKRQEGWGGCSGRGTGEAWME